MNRTPEASGGARIDLQDVRFAYPGGAPMRFDLAVAASDIVAVMGPSGSGKSTLLSLIAGFEAPTGGRILIDGGDIGALAPHQRPVSMVFQENNLFAHLTVAQNVGLGRSASLRLSAGDHEAIADALARTGLAGKENRLPHALSGGERQRVALARVLLRRRPVLLLDEPFASLGPALSDEMLALIAALHDEQRMTVLMATHDPHDAEKLSKTMVFVDNGTVAGTGPTADFLAGNGSEAFNRYIGRRGERKQAPATK
ncbi:thiamine ABC transporter ATP-binding protein [Nitratireductor sp. ZSWI3]|uniref:thiamine ABC transporter ATP-binding protein n=1 Tax=Nitratireductor sp. ZSWI3 TaxID=2966359 RepID=UPI0021501C33|nr:thiamine ABC transporter ATP-binding protein [Nitratireductor sp. ZSWI3]MCR4266580.1 thiamine ABC transporter ATP-binding protein [Nitratireductor sp. ZSWI3]